MSLVQPQTVLRFAGSVVLAAVVVTAMFVIGMHVWGVFDEEEPQWELEELRLLSARERLELAWLLGEERRVAPPRPTAEEIPRVPPSPRTITGFVQLEVRVAPDGTVAGVDVIGAAPAGVYEQQARDQVRDRRYTPPARGGSERHIEIVEFAVPATQAPAR
ncbi:hypothetical protein BH24PSE2_BH24PSE2_09000 [soil metagenome]